MSKVNNKKSNVVDFLSKADGYTALKQYVRFYAAYLDLWSRYKENVLGRGSNLGEQETKDLKEQYDNILETLASSEKSVHKLLSNEYPAGVIQDELSFVRQTTVEAFYKNKLNEKTC